jgi:nucleotide-binding universal stress UspA family protein
MAPFRHVLAAVDFDEPSRHAAELAAEIARKYEAELTVVHAYALPARAYAYPVMHDSVVTLELLDEAVKKSARASLDELVARLRPTVPSARAVLREGIAWREILAEIDDCRADLAVLGTHGRHGLSHVVFGSVAERVVRHARVPVLTAHPPETPR